MTSGLDELLDRFERHGASAPAIYRVGLGLAIALAGVHKLIDSGAWTVYVADWLAPFLLVSPRTWMVANGVVELGFGALLLIDRYTAAAAAVVALSLAGTVCYLAVVAVTDGRFVDVLIRDVGLTALAIGVFVGSYRREYRG